MTTDKTQIIRARVPNKCAEYLNDLSKKEGKSLSEIIRLIVTERMINDRMKNGLTAFEYYPAPTPRGRPSIFKMDAAAAADRSECSALRASPTTRGGNIVTCEAQKDKGIVRETSAEDTDAFKPMSAPVFPGTLEEYNEYLAANKIHPGQFRPPLNRVSTLF